MSVRARLGLVKGEQLRFPRFTSSGPLTRHIDSRGYDATTGIGPDLMQAACDAVRGMIDLLAARERYECRRRIHALQRVRRSAYQ